MKSALPCQLCFRRPATYRTWRNPRVIRSNSQHDLCRQCENARKTAAHAQLSSGYTHESHYQTYSPAQY